MKTRWSLLALFSFIFTLTATWIVSARGPNSPQTLDTWTTRAAMPTAREFVALVTANNGKLYAIGGEDRYAQALAMVEEYNPGTNAWTTKTSMPTARWGMGVALASNGKVYVIGGVSGLGGGLLSTVEEYDPTTDTWATKASLPTAREHLAVAASNGKLYAMGGYASTGITGIVEEYDPVMNTWRSRASLPTPRWALGAAATVDGRVYAIGGNIGGSVDVATVEMYDPTTDTWTSRASMSTARWTPGVVAARDGKIYAMNGISNGTCLATVEAYDPGTNSWQSGLSMPTARCNAAAAVSQDGFFVVGGAPAPVYGVPMLDVVEEAHVTSSLTWATRASMPTAREFMALVTADNGKLYAIGGENQYAQDLAMVEEYNPTTNAWITRTSMPTARWGLGAALAGNGKLYAIGGTTGGGRLNTVEEYDPATDTWATKASLPTARQDAAVTASNGKLYVIGGYASNGVSGIVEEYDPATNAWRSRANLPTPRWLLTAVTTADGKIYALGGNLDGNLGGSSDAATVEMYDPATNSWTSRASLLTARWAPVAVAANNGKIYVTSGSHGGVCFAAVEEYDPGTNSWQLTTSAPTARCSSAAAAIGSKFYVAGGVAVPEYGYPMLDVVEEASLGSESVSTDSLIAANGATYVPSTTVNLHWVINRTDIISDMQFSNDGLDYSGWLSFTTDYTWTLNEGDGTKVVYGQYRTLSNTVSAVMSDTVILDTQPPIGSVMINDNAPYASSVSVMLNLSATDLSGADAFQISNDGSTYSSWVNYTHTYSWTLASSDGFKTVFVRYRDRVGHESDPVTDTITLYTGVPTGSLLINDGNSVTGSPNVTLAITATDAFGIADMCLANAAAPCITWEPFATSHAWALPITDGLHLVTAYVRNFAGGVTPLTDSILLDTAPPTATVNALAPYYTSLDFTVSWSGSDAGTGLTSFDVQTRDGEGVWTDWLTATTALSETFVGLDGHTFYFRARGRDAVGNVGSFAPGNGDIATFVDSRRPGGDIAINGGAIDTISSTVVLVLNSADATHLAFSDDGTSFTAVEPFAAAHPYQLPAGDGLKTVYVRYENIVGNTSIYSDTINLDTSVPGDVGLSINNDDLVTTQVTVTLTLKAPPGTRQMMVSNSSRFVGAAWEPYSITRTWVLAYNPYVSVYEVYARFRAMDGTVSPNYNALITLHLDQPPPPVDTTPPSGSVVINAGANFTSVPTVTLDALAADNPGGSGVRWMYFREWKYDPTAVQWVIVRSSGWLTYTETSTPWILSPGSGVKYLGAWFADGANNVSNPAVLANTNLINPGDTLTNTQSTQYRQTFEPGEQVTVTLVVTTGDADLYIWRPDSTGAPDYWSNQAGTATEQLAFTAMAGEYLIEVHGYDPSSQYTLTVETSGSGSSALAARYVERQHSSNAPAMVSGKLLPIHPLVTTKPGAVETPGGSPRHYLYLPLIMRY